MAGGIIIEKIQIAIFTNLVLKFLLHLWDAIDKIGLIQVRKCLVGDFYDICYLTLLINITLLSLNFFQKL